MSSTRDTIKESTVEDYRREVKIKNTPIIITLGYTYLSIEIDEVKYQVTYNNPTEETVANIKEALKYLDDNRGMFVLIDDVNKETEDEQS